MTPLSFWNNLTDDMTAAIVVDIFTESYLHGLVYFINGEPCMIPVDDIIEGK